MVPEGRNIRALAREDAELTFPPGVLARLKAEANRSGGPATRTETVVYEHDLDTQETDPRAAGARAGVGARLLAAGRGAQATATGASGRAQAYLRSTAARALDATGSAVDQYESGRVASRKERSAAEEMQGQAQAEYDAALQHYTEIRRQTGASGRLRSLAGRIRGDEEPDEIQDAHLRLQEAEQNLRQSRNPERASLGKVGTAARLIERAERQGKQAATSDRTQNFLKLLKSLEATQKSQKGGNNRRKSSGKKQKERRPSYQQPTIIVVREQGPSGRSGRRYGGL